MNKIYRTIILIFIILPGLAVHTSAQKPTAQCYEIKYLDAFELPANDSLFMPDSFTAMNEKDKQAFENDKDTVNFLVPMLVYEMQYCHPACKKNISPAQFEKLFGLYCIMRKKDSRMFASKSLEEKLEYVKQDFHSLVNNDAAFLKMEFTFDEGPLYGEDVNAADVLMINNTHTEFGSLCTFKIDKDACLMARDKTGKILWAKKMTQASGGPHSELYVAPEDITYTSAICKVRVGSEDYNMALYLRPDGRFMAYYHHW